MMTSRTPNAAASRGSSDAAAGVECVSDALELRMMKMMKMMMTEDSVTGDIVQFSDWTHWRRCVILIHSIKQNYNNTELM